MPETVSSTDHLTDWEARLAQRGILEAAQHAGVTAYHWKKANHKGQGTPGWAIPLYDEHGQPYLLPDGRRAQRWKNFNSSAGFKYAWGYADSPAGQTKPDGCDIYFPLPISIREVIAEHGHSLIIACGEPDAWTFVQAGMLNVISFFGEQLIPPDFIATLQDWGVQTVYYYPDRDKTGQQAAHKLAALLAGSDIQLCCCRLPEQAGREAIKDINDYYCALGCSGEAFRDALATLAEVPLIPDAAPLMNHHPPVAHKELPQAFYEAIEQTLGVRHYKPDGWSKPVACPFQDHEHDHRQPAAAWHRDKHILKCFKCGQTWLAIQVGEALGLHWRDFCPSDAPLHTTQDSSPLPEDDDPDETFEMEQGLSHLPDGKLKTPTHDDIGEQLMAQWQGTTRYFYQSWYGYQDGVWTTIDEEIIRRQIWQAARAAKDQGFSPSQSGVSSILDYVKSELHLSATQIDQNLNMLNLRNGLFDLCTGTLEPHQPEQYMTTQLPFDYDPTAQCPTWERFLQQALVNPQGQPDPQLIALLQEAFGYSLTGETHYETAFWLYGEAATGKSTVLTILQALLGSAFLQMNLSQLDKNHYQLANIPGKRVVAASEARKGAVLADDLLKTLISGEEMAARQIYSKSFTFKPQAKVWWAMNDLPSNKDRSNAIYRRLLIIPFGNPVPADRQNRRLASRLQQELPGIFNWALEGLHRLSTRGGFTQVQQVLEALKDYRQENDLEASFIRDVEWCELDPNGRTQASKLYMAYKAWAEKYGERYKSATAVAKDWERLGLEKLKQGNCYYQGVRLTDLAYSVINTR